MDRRTFVKSILGGLIVGLNLKKYKTKIDYFYFDKITSKNEVESLFDGDDEFYKMIKSKKPFTMISSRTIRVPLQLKPTGNFKHIGV